MGVQIPPKIHPMDLVFRALVEGGQYQKGSVKFVDAKDANGNGIRVERHSLDNDIGRKLLWVNWGLGKSVTKALKDKRNDLSH